MSTPGSWKQIIPAINPTDQVKASVVNNPITALAERTDYLRAVVEGISSSEFTYVQNVAVTTTSKVGHLVYWNSVKSQFDSALAKWDDSLLNSDGTLKPAESAVVAGLLVNKFTSNTGSIILGGYVRNFANPLNLFGTTTPTVGIHYLSADTAGEVTTSTPPLAILAMVYLGEDNLIMPTVRFEHSTHDHKRYTLDSTLWLTANITNFPDMDIPTGATFGYDLVSAPDAIKEIFTLYPGIAAFTYVTAGDNVPVAFITVTQDNIWWFEVASPADDLYMWLTAPNSHGPNIVRAMTTDTPNVFLITLENGLATISKKDFTETTTHLGYTVVKDLTNDNIKKTGYVVERIIAGDGLDLVSSSAPVAGQGVVEIALSEYSNKYIDASMVNLNNALELTVDDIIYTAFPSDRESSMIGVAEATRWTSGDPKKGAVWLWVKGPSTNGSPFPNISVEVLTFPDPEAAAQTIPASPVSHTITGLGTTASDKYYLIETDEADRFDVTSQSQVQYKLTLDNTETWDCLVLRQGIRIYEV